MRYAIMCFITIGLGFGQAALALEADQVRGRIVSVAPDEERLELRVQAAGDQRQARAGQVIGYRISPDTEVRVEDPRESLTARRTMTVDDLEEGAQVVLNFERVGGELVARRVATSDSGPSTQSGQRAASSQDQAQSGGQDLAQADTRSGRSRLPDTASALPLLAYAGAGFALMALVIRSRRKR